LDGELFTKRGDFSGVSSVLRKKVPIDREWKKIVYLVFDVPKINEPFFERFRYIKSALKSKPTDGYYLDTEWDSIKILKQYKVTSKDQLFRIHASVVKLDGEGVMLRDPNSYYTNKRDKSLLKYKHFHDSEAIVESHSFGKGRHADKMGNLSVRWIQSGVSFDIGGGFTDDQRKRYHELFSTGTIVKFRFFEVNESGKPRFPTFLGIVPKVLSH